MLMRTLILRAAAIAVVLGPIVAIAQGGKTKTATYITTEGTRDRSEHPDGRHRQRELQHRNHPPWEDGQRRHGSRRRRDAERSASRGEGERSR